MNYAAFHTDPRPLAEGNPPVNGGSRNAAAAAVAASEAAEANRGAVWLAIYGQEASEGDEGSGGGGQRASDGGGAGSGAGSGGGGGGGGGGGRNSPVFLPAMDYEISRTVVAHVQVRASVVHDVKAVASAPMRAFRPTKPKFDQESMQATINRYNNLKGRFKEFRRRVWEVLLHWSYPQWSLFTWAVIIMAVRQIGNDHWLALLPLMILIGFGMCKLKFCRNRHRHHHRHHHRQL